MNLTNPIYQDADKARAHLEAIRWPRGPVCPHCGSESKDHYELKGKTTRPGLYKCKDCVQPFTVTVGTVFERSKIPLNKWVLCAHLMAASKKGYSQHQMHRTLGVTYKTAWFMTHRIREAMRKNPSGLLGGGGKVVEADEAYFGTENDRTQTKGRGGAALKQKNKILALVERNGEVRSYHVADVNGENLKETLKKHIHSDTHVMTDSSPRYNAMKREKPFKQHSQVNHSKGEYARGEVTTNRVEGFFSVMKRGLIGTYHHVSSDHLQRYLNEFDFRYNNRDAVGVTDGERTIAALKGISGKRLTYRRINAAS